MKPIVLAFFFLFNATLHASSSGIIALAFAHKSESAVALTVPATFLAAEIRIESGEEDWGLKLTVSKKLARS